MSKALKASRQTKLKLKKGFHNAPITYKVLMNHQFNEEDQKIIARGLVKAITPKAAEQLLPAPGKPSKWTLQQNTSVGIIGTYTLCILKYKGLEVAVFWKRQTSEVTPDPSDPVPEGVLESPDDVWARLDLFNKSPRQLVNVVANDLETLQREHVACKIHIEAQARIIEANNKTIASLQGKLSALEAKTKQGRK